MCACVSAAAREGTVALGFEGFAGVAGFAGFALPLPLRALVASCAAGGSTLLLLVCLRVPGACACACGLVPRSAARTCARTCSRRSCHQVWHARRFGGRSSGGPSAVCT